MKKFTLLLTLLLGIVGEAKIQAQVEWTIWEGEVTGDNVQGASKLDFSTLEAGDIIYVYGSGTLSKAIYRISGSGWETWTALQSYSPAVSDGNNYYHVITADFLTNFNYSSDDTKSWAVGNWDTGTITKVTIRKGKSMIKTTLSADSKSTDDSFEYTISNANFTNMVAGDFLRLPASKRDEAVGKSYKVEFKEGENDWTTYTTLWGPTHDAIWQVGSSTINDGIKDHPLYIYGELYNTSGVYMYHPINSFSIGQIGYATFSANQQVTAPNTVTAYKATVDGSSVLLSPFTNNVIPANTGAIIKGDQGAVLEFTASSVETSETSALHAVTTATSVSSLTSGYDYYVLYDNVTNTALSLDNSDVNLLWNSATYNNKEMTLGAAWGSCGWQTNDIDYSAYEKVVVEFNSATTIPGSLKIGYTTGEDEAKDFAAGATSVELDFDKTRSDHVKWIYITGNEQTSGSYTFKSAYLVKHTPEFRKTNSGTLAANKAYLAIPTGGGARSLNIVFDDEQETTAIETVAPKALPTDNVYYNLRGQRVAQPTRGLYIVNGRKVVIK